MQVVRSHTPVYRLNALCSGCCISTSRHMAKQVDRNMEKSPHLHRGRGELEHISMRLPEGSLPRTTGAARSNQQRSTSDQPRLTSDQHRLTSDLLRLTSSQQRSTSGQQRSTSNQQRSTSDQQRSTSVQQQSTSASYHDSRIGVPFQQADVQQDHGYPHQNQPWYRGYPHPSKFHQPPMFGMGYYGWQYHAFGRYT